MHVNLLVVALAVIGNVIAEVGVVLKIRQTWSFDRDKAFAAIIAGIVLPVFTVAAFLLFDHP